MAPFQDLGPGDFANDGTGDPLRAGALKIINNFGILKPLQIAFSATLDMSGGARLMPVNTLSGALTILTPVALEEDATCIMLLTGGSVILPPKTHRTFGYYDPTRLNCLVFRNIGGTTPSTAILSLEISSYPIGATTGLYFRQNATSQANMFLGWAAFLNTAAATPATADKYSRLNLLESQGRHTDGYFYFRLKYADSTNIEWRQWSNPLRTYSQVVGYSSILGTAQIAGFGGLSLHTLPFFYMTVVPGSVEALRGTLGATKFQPETAEGQPGVGAGNKLVELSVFTP